MKRRRFSEEQIIGILKEHEAGVSVADLCRKRGVIFCDASIYEFGRFPPTFENGLLRFAYQKSLSKRDEFR